LAENVVVSTSCSLLHSAVDLKNETKLDAELKSWLAFAAQKLLEVVALASAAAGKKDEVMQTCSICFLLFPKACSSKECFAPQMVTLICLLKRKGYSSKVLFKSEQRFPSYEI
jgi:hypothetical protein